MKVLIRLSLIVCAVLFAAPVSGSVIEAWLQVQEVLSAEDERALDQPVDELVNAAQEIDVRRMTPYASALVAWSIAHPEEGDAGLETAIRIDPELPTSYFILSSRSWRRGSYTDAVKYYLQGWTATLRSEGVRRHLLMSIGIWVIIGVAAASLVSMVVLTMRTIRCSAHDAMELGNRVFERANAVVFGLVLLLLPLFAGLGPAWLLAYLFVLGWAYLDSRLRVIAIAVCLFLALVPVILESWQRALLRVPPVSERIETMLDERQLDPSALREFLNLKDDFDADPLYHLILGELLRMHSAVESAKVEFQTAASDPRGDSRPFVFLGNMALEDGNVQLAIQHYDSAIDTNPNTALAYHNLSSAYDLIRRFQQGDAARARARELAGGRSASLGVRGRDPRVRYPRVDSTDVREFVSNLPEEGRLLVGYSSTSWRSALQLLNPISALFWVTGAIGLGLLFVRSKWFPPSRECTKCGKVYRLDDEPGESAVYCRQCVSVFLQRDLVPIDQQTVKLAQVRRWDRWTTMFRRLVSAVAPGSIQLINGQAVLGAAIAVTAWMGIVGATVWAPKFIEVIEPAMPTQPIFVVLGSVVVISWLVSVLGAWQRS